MRESSFEPLLPISAEYYKLIDRRTRPFCLIDRSTGGLLQGSNITRKKKSNRIRIFKISEIPLNTPHLGFFKGLEHRRVRNTYAFSWGPRRARAQTIRAARAQLITEQFQLYLGTPKAISVVTVSRYQLLKHPL